MSEGNHLEHHCLRRSWYKEPLFIIISVILATYFIQSILSFIGIGVLVPLFEKFFSYLRLTWWAVILGLLIGALIEVLVPEELMANLLARGKRSILVAVLLGFVASACSHGILAIAVSLYKKGASIASTLAFLLAAPWANLAITILLFSLFGIKALLIIGGALVVAVVSGFVFQELEDKKIIEGRRNKSVGSLACRPPAGRTGQAGIKSTKSWGWPGLTGFLETIRRIEWLSLSREVGQNMWALTKMVVWWILLGFFLASLIGTFVPEHFFYLFFGPNLSGTLATLVLASVIEVCSEGSAPLAFELFQKTNAFGNVFVFLMAGVATDFTEIGVITTNLGKKAALALILVAVPQILLLGFVFNYLIR